MSCAPLFVSLQAFFIITEEPMCRSIIHVRSTTRLRHFAGCPQWEFRRLEDVAHQ
jgi:hypothetical protein